MQTAKHTDWRTTLYVKQKSAEDEHGAFSSLLLTFTATVPGQWPRVLPDTRPIKPGN